MTSLFIALALTAQCPNGQCSTRSATRTVVVSPAPTVPSQAAQGFTKTVVKTRPRLFGGLFRGRR